MARVHYPFIPTAVVPDAYPNLRRRAGLRSPVLVIHGEDDMIVPVDRFAEMMAIYRELTAPSLERAA